MVVEHLGTNHADEIPLSPETNAQDTLLLIAGNGDLPQPVIEPLSKNLTRRSLDALSLPNSFDEDGDSYTVLPSGDGRSDLVCYFIVYGETRKMFHLVCLFDAPIPKRKWGAALQLCNAYNTEACFGRAVLRTQEGQELGTLRFDAAMDCTDGISQEFLQTLISSHIASACMFYNMAHEDKALGLTRSKNRRATKYQEVTTAP
jgi:hypothetical protein